MSKCIFLDGEGVIWYGGSTIDRAVEAVDRLRTAGYRVCVLTNNCAKSSEQYVQRLVNGGFHGFTADDVVTSSVSTSSYLVKRGYNKPGRSVFVIGSEGYAGELRNCGINVLTAADFSQCDAREADIDPNIGAVVVGTSEDFSCRDITIGTRIVVENDAILLSANSDVNYPFKRNVLVPGAYSLALCIGSASGREPIALGKPNIEFSQSIKGFDEIDKANSWMIGDRLDTDVLFAHRTGLKSALVLTGVAKAEDVPLIEEAHRPDIVCSDVYEAASLILNQK